MKNSIMAPVFIEIIVERVTNIVISCSRCNRWLMKDVPTDPMAHTAEEAQALIDAHVCEVKL